VVTIPLGYNTEIDRLLKEGELRFTKEYYLKKISRDNAWAETSRDGASTAKYDFSSNSAHSIVVGVLEKPLPAPARPWHAGSARESNERQVRAPPK